MAHESVQDPSRHDRLSTRLSRTRESKVLPGSLRLAIASVCDYANTHGCRRTHEDGIGAPYTFALGHEGVASVGVVCHPSRIEPNDLEKMAEIDFPILFNVSSHASRLLHLG